MIEITENYAIEAGDGYVTVYKKRIPETGKSKGILRWVATWHFPNYETALMALVDREINEMNASEFSFVVDKIKTLKQEILSNLPKLSVNERADETIGT